MRQIINQFALTVNYANVFFDSLISLFLTKSSDLHVAHL